MLAWFKNCALTHFSNNATVSNMPQFHSSSRSDQPTIVLLKLSVRGAQTRGSNHRTSIMANFALLYLSIYITTHATADQGTPDLNLLSYIFRCGQFIFRCSIRFPFCKRFNRLCHFEPLWFGTLSTSLYMKTPPLHTPGTVRPLFWVHHALWFTIDIACFETMKRWNDVICGVRSDPN